MDRSMSTLEALIKELCPNGVEWKTLGDILVRTKGTKITAQQMHELHKNNGEIRIFAGGKTFADVANGDIPQKDINQQPSIIVKSRGNIEFEYYAKPFSHKNEFWSYYSDRKDINIKFVHYFLIKNTTYFQRVAEKMQMPQISIPTTDNYKIPIPPLPIQREIVRILDTFTELTAELEAELEARKKQYEYYRDTLLTFGDEVEWKALGEVGNNLDYMRKPVTKNLRTTGKYPYYGASGIVDFVSDYILDGDFLLVSEDGANLLARKTPIAFSISGKAWVNNHAHIIQFEHKTTQRFVELYLSSIDLSDYINTAAQPKITQASLNSIKIPIPPIAEQERIVAILDRFDALTHDIAIGLPAEIAARKKQYEYYRDQLLTFKEVSP